MNESRVRELLVFTENFIVENPVCIEIKELIKENMMQRGKEKILLADHTKVKIESGFAYGSLTDFNCWITTSGIKKEQLDKYENMTDVSIQK